MKRWLALMGLMWAITANAQERALICYNYGCQSEAEVSFGPLQLDPVRAALSLATDAAMERDLLAMAVGNLYRWAGEWTPISADRAGDFADQGVNGRMDCIDHAQSTTALLRMVERQGWLRFHRVLEPARRTRFIFQHFSAVVEELRESSGDEALEPPRYVIDSWFVEHGEPAVVLPLDEWLDGGGPHVP